MIASEYPSKPIQFAAYAFALAISASCVTARRHFPSDVIVGSTFGFLIGRYVVHHHAAGAQSSALMITPMLEQSTRTYGLHIGFMPNSLNFTKAGSFISRLIGTCESETRLQPDQPLDPAFGGRHDQGEP